MGKKYRKIFSRKIYKIYFLKYFTRNRQILNKRNRQSVFGSVVTVAFQITFHAEIHANDVFLFFKNYF
jgi:hypothetical protein